MSKDIRTKAIVLRRTNYSETDRILNLLTPEGNFAVLAKGVRKEKSRLAGGIELFCVSDVVIHEGRGKLATLTSAKMITFYSNLLLNLEKLELASKFLKQINRLSEQVDSPDFFNILDQSLSALNNNLDPRLVESWHLFNLAKTSGAPPNLHYDTSGEKLCENKKYAWNTTENALDYNQNGTISANHIKLMRLMTVTSLETTAKINNIEPLFDDILHIAKNI